MDGGLSSCQQTAILYVTAILFWLLLLDSIITSGNAMRHLFRYSRPQSNGDDVGNGDGNKVVGNKESNGKGDKSNGNGDGEGNGKEDGDGKGRKGSSNGNEDGRQQRGWWQGGKSDGDSNKGGGQATKRVTARVGRAVAMAMRMVGNKESDGKGSKSNGDGNEGGGWATGAIVMAMTITRVIAKVCPKLEASKDYLN